MKEYTVTKNILYNFVAQGVLAILGIVSSPFIIHKLGNDAYGVWSLVFVFIGYLSILDFGFGQAIIKYISEYDGKNNKKMMERIIKTALTFYIGIGIVGSILLISLSSTIATKWFQIPLTLVPLTITIFYISSIGFFINMILAVLNSIPVGLQRMDLVSQRNIVFGFVNTLGIVWLLALGQGLYEMIIWTVLVNLVATVIFALVIKKLLPDIKFSLGFDKEIFLKLIHFSTFKFISNVSGQVVFQIDRVLIGIFLPVATVTYYVAPLLLIQRSFSFLTNITSAVFPAISQSYGVEDIKRVSDLYVRMTRVTIFSILPFSTLFFLFADQILYLWLGSEFLINSTTSLKILALSYFFVAASAPAVITADAMGKANITAVFGIISAIINITAAVILIPRFGIEGAAWALFINCFAQVPLFVILVSSKLVKVSPIMLFKLAYVKPVFSAILSGIVAFYISGFMISSVIKLLVGVIIFGLLYLLFSFLINTFDKADRLTVLYFTGKAKDLMWKKQKV